MRKFDREFLLIAAAALAVGLFGLYRWAGSEAAVAGLSAVAPFAVFGLCLAALWKISQGATRIAICAAAIVAAPEIWSLVYIAIEGLPYFLPIQTGAALLAVALSIWLVRRPGPVPGGLMIAAEFLVLVDAFQHYQMAGDMDLLDDAETMRIVAMRLLLPAAGMALLVTGMARGFRRSDADDATTIATFD